MNIETVECDKLIDVCIDRTIITEFIEHLVKKGMFIAEHDRDTAYPHAVSKSLHSLLMDYFDIDERLLKEECSSLKKYTKIIDNV